MHSDQLPYFELWNSILSYEQSEIFSALLVPWVDGHADECAWLKSFSEWRTHEPS